jgi:hypothetical protein
MTPSYSVMTETDIAGRVMAVTDIEIALASEGGR